MKKLHFNRITKRKITNMVFLTLFVFATIAGFIVLFSIIFSILKTSLGSINWGVFTKEYIPTSIDPSGGGLKHAIIGQLILVLTATIVGIPLGLAGGIYLAEYSHGSKLGRVIDTVNDLQLGLPSIIIGIFVYSIVVAPMKQYSGIAGSIALTIILIPVILKVTSDMLKQVPDQLREAGYAIGAPPYRVILNITMRAAMGGIIAGVILALARVAGETAPLLFTSLSRNKLSFDMTKPMPSLPVTIYNYTGMSELVYINLAWVGSLILTLSILFITIIVKLFQEKKKNG